MSEGIDELCSYVRAALPLRARIAGRDRLDDLVRIAVTEWPVEELLACQRGSGVEERMLDGIARDVSRVYEAVRGSEKRYGFFWAFVLSSVVSAVVQLVLQWWLERPANRVKMTAWKGSMRGNS